MTSPGGNSDHQSNIDHPGDYVFVDLAHLDNIIGQWISVREDIKSNGTTLQQAIEPIEAPAGDGPSNRQAATYFHSLRLARVHGMVMSEYAAGYIDRLTASRERYLATEQDNADRLRREAD